MSDKERIVEAIGIVAIMAALGGLAFTIGRHTAPVKTVTQIVEVVKKVDTSDSDKKKQQHKKTTITEITHPDGTKEKITVITDDVESDTQKHTTDTTNISRSETDTKESPKGSPVTISALGGAPISFGSNPLIYGASITKPVLGPVTIGVWGLSNSTGGLSIGLTF